MKPTKQQQPTITLPPPLWRCAHGAEFRVTTAPGEKPNYCPRSPSCRAKDIEMVVEVDPVVFSRKEKQ